MAGGGSALALSIVTLKRVPRLLLLIAVGSALLGATFGEPLESRADAVVIIIPAADMALHHVSNVERRVTGQVATVTKGSFPPDAEIVHAPRVFVHPLRANVPARLYLKKLPDPNTWVIIGVVEERVR
jgi:hypothetical protein